MTYCNTYRNTLTPNDSKKKEKKKMKEHETFNIHHIFINDSNMPYYCIYQINLGGENIYVSTFMCTISQNFFASVIRDRNIFFCHLKKINNNNNNDSPEAKFLINIMFLFNKIYFSYFSHSLFTLSNAIEKSFMNSVCLPACLSVCPSGHALPLVNILRLPCISFICY